MNSPASGFAAGATRINHFLSPTPPPSHTHCAKHIAPCDGCQSGRRSPSNRSPVPPLFQQKRILSQDFPCILLGGEKAHAIVDVAPQRGPITLTYRALEAAFSAQMSFWSVREFLGSMSCIQSLPYPERCHSNQRHPVRSTARQRLLVWRKLGNISRWTHQLRHCSNPHRLQPQMPLILRETQDGLLITLLRTSIKHKIASCTGVNKIGIGLNLNSPDYDIPKNTHCHDVWGHDTTSLTPIGCPYHGCERVRPDQPITVGQ